MLTALVLAVFVLSAVALAVMVTAAEGTAAGAVYVAVAPLAVWAVIDPQPTPPQARLQSTPELSKSLVTVATAVVVPFTWSTTAGWDVIAMLIGGGVREMVIEFALAVFVASAVALAVITTTAAGTVAGAV
jgi:hypothetical protein